MAGGKALILAEQMGEEGTLLCNDRSADRKARLLRTIKVDPSLSCPPNLGRPQYAIPRHTSYFLPVSCFYFVACVC